MKKWMLTSLCALMPILGASAAPAQPPIHLAQNDTRTEQRDLVETATQAGKFKTLTRALQIAGLTDTLRSEGPYTVFAPTDEAFAKLPQDTLARLLSDRVMLRQVLLYHVLSGAYDASAIGDEDTTNTLADKWLTLRTRNGSQYINDARVIQANVEARNGVIHVVDRVMLPQQPIDTHVPSLYPPNEPR
ncbi:MAG: fasciclin domain-containing protein [Candidatus Sericytochromatia bacterium]